MLVGEIYHREPIIIGETSTIKSALAELLKDNVNGLIIVDLKNQVVGVLSLQDIAAALIPEQFKRNVSMANALYKRGYFREACRELQNQPVSRVMRREFIRVDLNTNIMAIMSDFLKNDLYIVPVLNGNQIIGIITRTEIKKAIAIGMELINYKHAVDL